MAKFLSLRHLIDKDEDFEILSVTFSSFTEVQLIQISVVNLEFSFVNFIKNFWLLYIFLVFRSWT